MQLVFIKHPLYLHPQKILIKWRLIQFDKENHGFVTSKQAYLKYKKPGPSP